MGRFRPCLTPLTTSLPHGSSDTTFLVSPTSPRNLLHFPDLASPRSKPMSTPTVSNQVTIEPPYTPMPWIWSCHKCHTRYHLGATRRCLQDGHYFCGGTSVDKVSGKVKKHKACVSEFDYSGWEDFSRWKKARIVQTTRPGSKHCEDECKFPSSCRWEKQHAVQDAEPAHLDPIYFDEESDALSVTGQLAVQKDGDNFMGNVRETAERRTTKAVRANLSTIEEEGLKEPSFLDAPPELNGLGLHHPVMGFLSSKDGAEESGEAGGKRQIKLDAAKSLDMLARVDRVWEEAGGRTEWIGEDGIESPPISRCAQLETVGVPFDFRFEQDEGVAAFLAEDDSPVSPIWDPCKWIAGGIGVALSPPDVAAEVEGEMGED